MKVDNIEGELLRGCWGRWLEDGWIRKSSKFLSHPMALRLVGRMFHLPQRQERKHELGVEFIELNRTFQDFPGGTVVMNLPANARGHGFDPWSNKISRAAEQLSPCATTSEPVL